MTTWIGSLVFVLAITVAIALHEWGHYWTARRSGMRAERFFIGFGPTVWSTRRGETEYGVKWFFIGGFVRIAGMSPGDERQPPVADAVFGREAVAADRATAARDEGLPLTEVPAVPALTWRRLRVQLGVRGLPQEERDALVAAAMRLAGPEPTAEEAARATRSAASDLLPDTGRVGDLRHRVLRGDQGRFFHDRPAWQRAIVLASGSAMHFVQAVVLLFVAFWAFDTQPVPVIAQVIEGSPAASAGMAPGDRIVAVDGEPVEDFAEARQLISARPGEPVELTVEGPSGERASRTLTTAIVVGDLGVDSALAEAGLRPDDELRTVGGEPVDEVADLRAAAGPAGTVPLTVARTDAQGETHEATVELPPELLDTLTAHLRGLVGFVPDTRGLGPVEALEETFLGELSIGAHVGATFRGIGLVFSPEGIADVFDQLAGEERDPLGGQSLVGVTRLAGEVTAAGAYFALLLLIVALNVFVGILNLAPLPPLDGGHLAVLGVEEAVNSVRRVRGRPADFRLDPRAIAAIAIPVIVFFGLFFIALVTLDITNPIRLPQ